MIDPRLGLLLTLLVTLALVRPAAVTASPAPTLLAQPPSVSMRSEKATPTGDLSAGVRVHRGEHSMDVWLVTPHSMHWALAATAPPLSKQLAAMNWPRAGGAGKSARFERLPPRLQTMRSPRLWRAMA